MEAKVYTISQLKDILGISRTKAYDYVLKVYKEQEPFRVIKIGSSYRIIKSSFDKWFDGSP